MNLSKLNAKTGMIVGAAAAGVTLTVAGYFLYKNGYFRKSEDADEGIGDVDSIISDGDVEGEGMSQASTAATCNTELSASAVELSEKENNIDENVIMEQSSKELLRPTKILVLGLDKSGKSCMLNALAHQLNNGHYKPTLGFNAVQIEKDGMALSIMEVGGGTTTRAYWKNFIDDTSLLIYVVDGSDFQRFKEAKQELIKLLESVTLVQMDCLFISNKQDVNGARKIDQVFSNKDLNDIGRKGVSNITLLNTVCIGIDGKPADGDLIMDIVISVLKESHQSF